jgi:hypothetical protein
MGIPPPMVDDIIVTSREPLAAQRRVETVRKVPNSPAAWSSGTPKRGLSVHFFLRILAKATLGAFLVPLFGQFQSSTLAIQAG